MYKLYNNQSDITSALSKFLMQFHLRKTQLNIIPSLICGMIMSESCVCFDIANKLKGPFKSIQLESIVRRLQRFFNNKLFQPYLFYDEVIRFVISHYKCKHNEKKVHIIFDHMYMRDHFTVLMFSLRVGKQSIPLWFLCFSGKSDPNAYTEELIKQGIDYVYDLFLDKDYKLIFLADRWFNSAALMQYIDSLNCIYNIRLKENISCLVYDKKEGHKVWKSIEQLPRYKYHSVYYEDILYTKKEIPVNIVISSSDNVDSPWIIITNGKPNRALRDYSYRFGGIEFLFKNDKSNGFQLEDSSVKNLDAFITMYTMISFSVLWMTILGCHYTKNLSHYPKHLKISYCKGNRRVISLFRLGIKFFNRVYESPYEINLPCSFILYDV